MKITVAQSGKGDFLTVGEAFAYIDRLEDKENRIFVQIEDGVYREKPVLNRSHVYITGNGKNATKIVYDDGAFKKHEDGKPFSTFQTPTLTISGDDCHLARLTIENDAGFGRVAGQAVALYADGDRLIVEDCALLGSQDTLFVGPMPPTNFLNCSFTAPKELAPRKAVRQLYKKCFIRGDVDFIFGGGCVWFEECEIFSQDAKKEGTAPDKCRGYITAASTPRLQPYGFVFYRCCLTGNCPEHTVYLGRPWRNYAKTAFIECAMGAHIKPEGWHDWNKEDAHHTVSYEEYYCTGPGADRGGRAGFSHELTETYKKEQVLGNWGCFDAGFGD